MSFSNKNNLYPSMYLFIITDFPSPVYEVIKDITNHAGTIFQGTGCYMKKVLRISNGGK